LAIFLVHSSLLRASLSWVVGLRLTTSSRIRQVLLLEHLPLDVLKIGGEFVALLTTSQTDRLLIRATVDIARGLGKKAIAATSAARRPLCSDLSTIGSVCESCFTNQNV
jgi:hypothetical protein